MRAAPDGVLTIAFSLTTLEDYRRSGQLARLRRIVERYADVFSRVYLCTADTKDFTRELGIAKVWHLGMPDIPARRYLSLILLPVLHWRALKETSVVRTFNTPGGLTGALVRRLSGACVFVSYGYSWPEFVARGSKIKGWLARHIERLCLAAADQIIVATADQRTLLAKRLVGKPILLLPNFVDTSLFRPRDRRASEVSPTLLAVGRLEPQKNYPLLFDALEQLAGRLAELRVLVVGDGRLRLALQGEAERRSLPVEFAGSRPFEELPGLYAGCWAYVLSSDYEGLPKALLEAMACGAPCVGTNVAGTRDVIAHDVNGLLVPPGDAAALAAALVRLKQEPGLRRRLGQAARATIEAQYPRTPS